MSTISKNLVASAFSLATIAAATCASQAHYGSYDVQDAKL